MDTYQTTHDQWTDALQRSGLAARVEGRRPTPISSMDGLEVRFVTEQVVCPHLDEEDDEGVGAAYDDVGAAAAILHQLGKCLGLGVECNVTDEIKERLGVDIETSEDDALLGPAMRPILKAMLKDEADLERVDQLNERFADLQQRARDHRERFGDRPRTDLSVALEQVFGLKGADVDEYVERVCECIDETDYDQELAESLAGIFADARQLAIDALAFRPSGYSDAYVACVAASDYCLEESATEAEADVFLHDEQMHRELRDVEGPWAAPRADGQVMRILHSTHYYVLSNFKYAGRSSKGTQIGMWVRITASDDEQAQAIEQLAHYGLM